MLKSENEFLKLIYTKKDKIMELGGFLYHLENNDRPPYVDVQNILVEKGGYVYFNSKRYLVEEYIVIPEEEKDDYEDIDIMVYCTEVVGFNFEEWFRDIKLNMVLG
jgi:hypothetical protein